MSSKLSLAALIAGGVMIGTATTAQAADFGGDCCADLEERVAVLEATTARKGNRKVSLKIYGQVNQALLIWDDGTNSDAYVVDNDNSSSRFGFKGKAKIDHDWSAGYKIEIEVESASSVGVSQNSDDNGGTPAIRKSFLYLKSKTFGKISLGQNSVATDDITHDTQLSGTTGFVQPDIKYARDFTILNSAGNAVVAGLQWGELCGADVADDDQCFDISGRQNSIRYDSPTFAGFTLSAAWGEDDFWDVALRYAGDYGDIKIAAAVGYYEWDGNDAGTRDEETSVAASASIMHTPTGLFVNGAYRQIEVDFGATSAESDNFYIQAGIAQRWNSLGKTIIYGEYANSEDGALTSAANGTITGSDYDRWGIGIAQKIDAASMEVYALYRHHEVDLEVGGVAVNDIEDFDLFVIGSRIKF
jgi:predicted porin